MGVPVFPLFFAALPGADLFIGHGRLRRHPRVNVNELAMAGTPAVMAQK